MSSLGNSLYRIVFWTYERGSAPYDVAVVLIVVFVLLSPRGWFHDRPELDVPPQQAANVELLSGDASGGTQLYQVDARVLALPVATPELEHLLHDAVRKNVPSLQGRTFRIVSIDPVRGDQGNVISYRVGVQP